jgi:hypothetical protein
MRFMRTSIRREIAALSILLMAGFALVCCNGDARAQAGQLIERGQAEPQKQFIPMKQIALTEKQLLSVLTAAEAIRQIPADVPGNIEKLDTVARANGLASYDEYKTVSQSVGLTCAGFDKVTKKYVGRVAAIHARIARVKADNKMSAGDKQAELDRLNDQLEFSLPAVQYRGNIDLLARSNYCKRVGEAALQPLQ